MVAERNFKPRIIGFLCNWCCYGGADLCGVSRFQYPTYLRVIRVMCSGRVDLKFVIRALSNGADGVFVGGCHLNDCHYNTEGNYDALIMTATGKKLLKGIGINPSRFRLEWVSAGEGIRFAEIMNDFSEKVRQLGPLGADEGIDKNGLGVKLDAIARLVPYIKLVERKWMRMLVRSEAEYEKFITGGEFDRLYAETIGNKLAMSRILSLLRKSPLSTEEIAVALEMSPTDVSKHINTSSRHGFVKYDADRNRYAMVWQETDIT